MNIEEVEAREFFPGYNLVKKMADIAIRLPPLYMMDTILMNNLGVLTEPSLVQPASTNLTMEVELEQQLNLTQHIENSTDLYHTFSTLYGGNPVLLVLPHIARFLVCSTLFLTSLLLFLLPTPQVISCYRFLLCLLTLPLSYTGHNLMSTSDLVPLSVLLTPYITHLGSTFGQAVTANYLLQSSLALALKRLLVVEGQMATFTLDHLAAAMVLPCLLALLSVPPDWLLVSAFAANIVPAALMVVSLVQQAKPLLTCLHRLYTTKLDFINNFGLNTLLEAEWVRLKVPTVLRVFWVSRSLLLLSSHLSLTPGLLDLLSATKTVLVRGSDTVITVLGMTSVVSSLSHWLGVVFQVVLRTEDDEEKSVASVSAVLFFVLALQTGLTGMESEKRFQQICKNLCLLLTAILHFIHSMVQPVLMSLSASRSSNRSSHLRALSICLFLLLAPSLLVGLLWLHFKVGTWLLAVTAFCIEVVIKVVVTLLIYALFMWDAHCQDGLWESLDDWVYYIRSFGNTVEFCFAVFLFFNGGWILLFESGGTIRAIMMLIHAYFNIWCEARNGWSTFSKRRTAVAKINSLTDATKEELQKHNDVCAICYQEMVVAKRTRCRHMFHAICLRKWLYMQDNCPMCHEKLYQSDATSQTDQEDLGHEQADVVEDNEPVEDEINGQEDINQNYLEDSDEDFSDVTDSDEGGPNEGGGGSDEGRDK